MTECVWYLVCSQLIKNPKRVRAVCATSEIEWCEESIPSHDSSVSHLLPEDGPRELRSKDAETSNAMRIVQEDLSISYQFVSVYVEEKIHTHTMEQRFPQN